MSPNRAGGDDQITDAVIVTARSVEAPDPAARPLETSAPTAPHPQTEPKPLTPSPTAPVNRAVAPPRNAPAPQSHASAPNAERKPAEAGNTPPGNAPSPPTPSSPAEGGEDGANHPLVKQALELFGGRIMDIQHRRN